MATPRIFVSSTCYDLNEIRDNLYSFIESLGYTPVFSDKNDVFYHPDLHSHEACIKEIETCHIFILIVGGRFGGQYVYDDEKSIVNAEYEAAKKLQLPIFSFIKREVHEDHRVFTRNKKTKPKIYDQLDYPSIEKQETAIRIFDFIDIIRKSDVNNAYFTFEFARNIRDALKKQLAGLFFDFLWKRQKEKESERTNELLSNLTILGKKTEDIIENIYKKVDGKHAEVKLEVIENELNARKFWYRTMQMFTVRIPFEDGEKLENLSTVKRDETWLDFMLRTGRFEKKIKKIDDTLTAKILSHTIANRFLIYEAIDGELNSKDSEVIKQLSFYFEAYRALKKDRRKSILMDLE